MFLSIYIKRDNSIIYSILYNKIKKSFIVNLIKYDNNAITIAQYFTKQILINISVVVAIYVALLFLLSLIMRSLFKLFLQFINIIKKLFF